MRDGVANLRLPLEAEVVAQLLTDSRLDSLHNVGEDTEVGRILLIVLAALEDTRSDQTGVPPVQVTTDDVGRGVIADHVDVLGQLALLVDLFHPRLHDLVGVDVGGPLGLTVEHTFQVLAAGGLVLGLDGQTESTQVETGGALVLGRAEQVTLREVDGDVLGALGATGQETTVVGHEQVVDDLQVGHGVERLSEAQNGIELDLGEVARLGVLALLVREDAARRDGGIPGENVLGVNHVLEAVLLSNFADLVALSTANQHGVVIFSKSLHGGVRLDELIRRDGLLQDLRELLAASLLGLSTTVGQQDVGELDALS